MGMRIERKKEVTNDNYLEFASYSTKQNGGQGTRNNKPSSFEIVEYRSKMYCDLCKKWRHGKAECFKIVGYPDWWETKKKKGTKGQ